MTPGDDLLGRLLWAQLRSVGWFSDSASTDVPALKAAAGLPQHVERWLDATLEILDRQGLVRYDAANGSCTATGASESPEAVWQAWERTKSGWFADASLRPRLVIAEKMLRALPEVLRGEKLTTDVLFPNGSNELVRPVYEGNPLADLLNEVIAEAAVAYVRQRVADDPAARVRLLEIGAGTGATSRMVVRALEPYRDAVEEYCFTDLSKAFLFAAEEELGPAAPYLSCRLLDAERPPAEQGFELGTYDLVLATNVLHATRLMRRTVRHVKSLLRPNGLVLLNELAGDALSLHVAYGLLEGWWLHEDPDLRVPGSPGLAPESWQLVLEEAGFASVFFPVEHVHAAGGQIVIAESDGVLDPGPAAPSPGGTPAPSPSAAEVEGAHAPAPPAAEAEAASAPADQRARVRGILRDELARSLKATPEALDGDVALRDYGLDSILGIQLVQRLGELFGLELQTTVLFEYATLNDLADHLASHVTAEAVPQRVAAREPVDVEPIAVVGVSGRFAGSESVEELWGHLAAGDDLVGEATRWDLSQAGAGACRSGSFIDSFDEFDALFFGLSGVEAGLMDPQQRVFLEEAFFALENAGYAGSGLAGQRVGVYAGFTGGDYHLLQPGRAAAPQGMVGRAGSILSARIAYLLDLRGPAVTVDTACSSSLVAMHLAAQALRTGEVRMALAGGVFVLSTPEFYLSAGAAGMLSAAGRCATFSDGADGFVPAEGAGVVVLKRLSDALADGDHVHGLLLGSGVNQDGASNGITAPSVVAQEELECWVYERFGIDPGEIQVVEAHGTGTALGDPVEFTALTRAFRRYTDRVGYCALGAVKSNLGHAAAAAGVAGVLKVLLGMRHREIAPSLHFRAPNPAIDLPASPFYVNTELAPWPAGPAGRRLAAVSAFGFSGTNAHVVLAEAPPLPARTLPPDAPQLVVLSAPSAGQLTEHARRLAAWCCSPQAADVWLGDVSLTLATGRRRHRAQRLACTPRSIGELADLLDRWLDEGHAPGIAGSLEGPHASLAADFVRGDDVQLAPLFASGPYRRVPLPGSVLARRRYWVGEQPRLLPAADPPRPAALHPLVHRNTSSLRAQRYSTTLTGEEFFLADHVVQGAKVLPGVVSLEMARAAIGLAAEAPGSALRLVDVVWPRPLRFDRDAGDVHVTVTPAAGGRVAFAVHSGPEALDDDSPVHCQGEAELLASPGAASLDLARLRAECADDRTTVAGCYAALRAAGVEHGPRLRALDELSVGAGQALARLRLPAGVPQDGYWLHPSLLDAALQTIVALTCGRGGQATVPFAVDAVDVLRACPERPWVRTGSGDGRSFDLDICDEQGDICVRIRGLSGRTLGGAAAGEPAPREVPAAGTGVFVVPRWEPVAVEAPDAGAPGEVVVVAEEGPFRERLLEAYPRARVAAGSPDIPGGWGSAGHVVWLAPPSSASAIGAQDLVDAQEHGVLGLFGLVKALLRDGLADRDLQLTVLTAATRAVVAGEAVAPAHAGVHGLAGSLANEYPHWRVRLLDLPATLAQWPAADELRAVPATPGGSTRAFRDGCWYRQRWLPATLPTAGATAGATAGRLRRGGVYVVIGGAGGIGTAFSEYAARVYEARIVWLGRRPADPAIEAAMDRIATVGPRPFYLRADVTDAGALRAAYDEVKLRYGVVHGLVHSALELADRSLVGMTPAEFRATYDTKVAGSIRMLEVFGGEPLELVLFFSSLNAVLRAPGQSNYVGGCTFQDAFAHHLATGRPGRVKAIHWGWWGSVGAVTTAEHRARMQRSGLASIEPADGMAALEAHLAAPPSHAGYLRLTGSVELAGETILPPILPPATGRAAAPAPSLASAVGAAVTARHAGAAAPADWQLPAGDLDATAVRGLVAEVLGVDRDTVETGVGLEEYGWDRSAVSRLSALLRDRHAVTAGDSALSAAGTVDELAELAGAGPDRDVDGLLADLLWTQLRATGRFDGPRVDGEVLGEPLAGWLAETLRVLAARGFVRREGSGWVVLGGAPVDGWARWERAYEAWICDADVRAQVVVIDTVLRALPDVLSGRRLGTEVLFGDGSMELVQGLYQGNRLADFFNGVLADALVEYVQARRAHDRGVRLRVLEVGAGTGGTSAMLFERLAPLADAVVEYRYTDVSAAFLAHARETYGPRASYLQYGVLDIERSPVEQGFDAGGYDVVVAANVLHATRRVHRTLRHVKALLRPGGVLLVNELTRSQLWAHATFGLLEGWWLSEDPAIRIAGSPVLTSAAWRRALTDTGFTDVGFLLGEARAPQHHIILAESDGVIALEPTSEALAVAPPAPTREPEAGAAPPPAREPEAGAPPPPAREPEAGAPPPPARKPEAGAAPPPAREPEAVAPPVSGGPVEPARPADDEGLVERVVDDLRLLFARVLGLEPSDLDPGEPFETYGVDSIVVVQLTAALREVFGDVRGALLFEHRNLRSLAEHFAASRRDVVRAASDQQPPPPVETRFRPVEQTAGAPRPRPDRPLDDVAMPVERTAAAPVSRPNRPLDDVAIVGLAGRYPQADSLAEFWENLRSGRDCITEIPAERWDPAAHGICARWGGFLDGVDRFDPLFFNISPADAELMDPQERLFLQCAYATLQDAGYTRAQAAAGGQVGVFVGVMYEEYQLYGVQEQALGRRTAMAGSAASVANRVSYFCDFHGPSVAVDTMCSSSLTAIHLACQSIQRGESQLALAGGVNVSVHPNKYLMLEQGGFLSASGRCESFGAGGDGFVPSEGVGAVLLKPLARALADGDQVHGVIKGTAINHGGRTHGYTVPNPTAQGAAIRRALDDAGVDPATITYLETHGTGTSLGDPIEIAGLAHAFGGVGSPVAIGSVKSNIGHCESAAGIAGLTKIVLQLRHAELVPSLHAETLNPEIDFRATPFAVQRQLADWPPSTGLRRAGLSSFGAGGSNAHLIVEEPPAAPASGPHAAPALVVLSAKDGERLRESVEQLVDHITAHAIDLHDLAYTLQVGREAMEERLAVRIDSVAGLREQLVAYLGDQAGAWHRGRALRTAGATAPAGDPDELLRRWVDGQDVDWRSRYATPPRRISLPTYPFARERCWVPGSDAPTASPAAVAAQVVDVAPGPGRRADMRGMTVEQCLAQDLKEQLGSVLKVAPGRLDAESNLTDYGVDSIRIPQFASRLTQHFGIEVTPAMFFGFPTLGALAGHYLAEHGDAIRAFYADERRAIVAPAPVVAGGRPWMTAARPAPAASRPHDDEPIAIVGISGRFPGARDVDELWEILATGQDVVRDPDPDRFSGPFRGGWAPGVYEFDPEFFAMSPAEAELTDPRQRLLLQESWRALEDAAYGAEQVSAGKVGMFVGVEGGDYQLTHSGGGMLLGQHEGVLAARLAYFLNLDGPNMAINTACSSGLVAVHQACQSLRGSECAHCDRRGGQPAAAPRLADRDARGGAAVAGPSLLCVRQARQRHGAGRGGRGRGPQAAVGGAGGRRPRSVP